MERFSPDFFPCKFEYPGITFPRNKPPHQSTFLSPLSLSRSISLLFSRPPFCSIRTKIREDIFESDDRKIITTRSIVVIINSSINFKLLSHFHRKLMFYYGDERNCWFRFLGNLTGEKLVKYLPIYIRFCSTVLNLFIRESEFFFQNQIV